MNLDDARNEYKRIRDTYHTLMLWQLMFGNPHASATESDAETVLLRVIDRWRQGDKGEEADDENGGEA